MEIPIYVNQTERGVLRVRREGLYTVLEAELNGGAAEPVRLWAHGDGKSACLGVPAPKDGKLLLRRSFSRREMTAFPDPIRLVSDREREDSLHNTESGETETVEEAQPESPETEASEPEPPPEPPPETDGRACPWPAEPKEAGLLWYSRPDGTLVSFDGVSCLVAIPAERGCAGGQRAERVIEGRNYLIFRY